jgi:cellulose synthase/poly-beta-1,6-N-acetylglucosamine synthase-like glycosyltransferase
MVIGVLIIGILLFLAGIMYLALIGMFTVGSWQSAVGSRQSAVGSWQFKVSVMIAARDEENSIVIILNDLLQQDYPVEWTEIIIVDDHSGDKTADVVNDLIKNNIGRNIILLRNEEHGGSGKKDAISLGVSKATGDIILTTDADCRIGTGWISAMVSYFGDENTRMVFGPVVYTTGARVSDHFQALEFAGLMASAAGAAGAHSPFMCSGANLAYRKEAFNEVNGFHGNEQFLSGDDVFLMHKMKKEYGRSGIHFCKNRNSLVLTNPVDGIGRFISQRARWASKSKGYRDITAVWTALIVFIFNILLILNLLAGFVKPGLFIWSAGFLFLKIIIDFPLLWGFTGFTGQRRLLWWYLSFQAVYPVYILIAGLMSFLRRRKW